MATTCRTEGTCRQRICCNTWECQDHDDHVPTHTDHDFKPEQPEEGPSRLRSVKIHHDPDGTVQGHYYEGKQIEDGQRAYLGGLDFGIASAELKENAANMSAMLAVGHINAAVSVPKFTMTFEEAPGTSPQAVRVLQEAKEALDLFLEKNRGYGNTGYALGARGQYADMNRKMGKLRHTLWDGNESVGESVVEMLQDLVGHALLTIDYIKQEGTK